MNDPNEGIETSAMTSFSVKDSFIEMNDPNEGIETHFMPPLF